MKYNKNLLISHITNFYLGLLLLLNIQFLSQFKYLNIHIVYNPDNNHIFL